MRLEGKPVWDMELLEKTFLQLQRYTWEETVLLVLMSACCVWNYSQEGTSLKMKLSVEGSKADRTWVLDNLVSF